MGILNRRHVNHLLAAYLHNELDPETHARVTAHLNACAACREAFAAERHLAEQLSARVPALTHPRPGQLERLWPNIAAHLTAPPKRRPLPTWSMALTAALLVVMFLPLLTGGHVSIYDPGSTVTQVAIKLFNEAPTSPSYTGPAPTAVAQVTAAGGATLTPVPTPDSKQ